MPTTKNLRHMYRRFFHIVTATVLLFMLFCTASPAGATELDLPDARIIFEPPRGYCLLDANAHESDRLLAMQIRAMLQAQSQVLAIVGECRALQDFRAGTRPFLKSYGILAALKMDGEVVQIPGATRKQFIGMMARDFANLDWQEMRQTVYDTYHGYGTPMRAGEIKPLGVVETNDNALLAGFFANYGTNERLSYWGASILATTLIKDYPVSFNLYAEYKGDKTFAQLTEIQKRYIPHLIGLNEHTPMFSEQDVFFLMIAVILSVLILFWKKKSSARS